jgi:PAS domain S-box-containing protein
MEDARRQRVAGHRFSKSSARLFPIEPPPDGGDAGAAVGWLTGADGLAKHAALDHFFARSPELFGIGTWDGLILKVNAAWQRTLGYTAEELTLTSFWDRVHPEAHRTCRGAVRVLARAGTADVELRMPHKDGSDRWVSWSVVVAAGRLFAVGRDVTERWRPQKALAETQEVVDTKLSPRVLLAEDNRDTQRVMVLRLASAGFAVTPAPNGQVAVDLALAAQAAGRPFDVILMDIEMPVLDGYEATRTLRGAGYRHPIIAVTALTSPDDRDECLRFGCDDHVAKPIDWARLTGLIASCANHAPAMT